MKVPTYQAPGLLKHADPCVGAAMMNEMITHTGAQEDFRFKGSKSNHPVLELAILSTKISVAPQAVSSSITDAMVSFGTIELIATHSGSSKAVMVGARFPGVIFVAISNPLRAMLYWQSMNFCAAINGELSGCERGEAGLTDDPVYSRCNHVDEVLIGGVF